jgi:hypothetical protein
VKSVIVSRTAERRDLYEYLNQADFLQRVADAFRKAEQEIHAVAGISLEDFGQMRYRTGSIIVHKSYIAHFDGAPFLHAFFLDTERNIRDIEEIIDTRLRAELSYIDNVSVATSAYASLGVLEAEAIAPTALTPPGTVEAKPADTEAAAAPPPPPSSPAKDSPPAAAVPEPPNLIERIIEWGNRALTILLIILTLLGFLWWLVSDPNGLNVKPTRATSIPYQDIEPPAGRSRQAASNAPKPASCDIAKSEAEAAKQEPGHSECIRK